MTRAGMESMLISKPSDILSGIAKLPAIWERWDDDLLFEILTPEACMTAQLLLAKKIDRLTSFYEKMLGEAAQLNKREKIEQEEKKRRRSSNDRL